MHDWPYWERSGERVGKKGGESSGVGDSGEEKRAEGGGSRGICTVYRLQNLWSSP